MKSQKPPKKRSFLGNLWRTIAKNAIPLGAGDMLVDMIDGDKEPDPKEIIKAVTGHPTMSKEHKELLLKDADNELKEREMDDKDRAGARAIYPESKDQADELADFIMKWNLVGVGVIVLINVGVLIAAKKWEFDASIVLVIGNLAGMIIQSLLQERAQVVGFYFGAMKQKFKNVFGKSEE